jgi:hypothetical protein
MAKVKLIIQCEDANGTTLFLQKLAANSNELPTLNVANGQSLTDAEIRTMLSSLGIPDTIAVTRKQSSQNTLHIELSRVPTTVAADYAFVEQQNLTLIPADKACLDDALNPKPVAKPSPQAALQPDPKKHAETDLLKKLNGMLFKDEKGKQYADKAHKIEIQKSSIVIHEGGSLEEAVRLMAQNLEPDKNRKKTVVIIAADKQAEAKLILLCQQHGLEVQNHQVSKTASTNTTPTATPPSMEDMLKMSGPRSNP